MSGPLFPVGRLVATPGAIDLLRRSAVREDLVLTLLERHQSGDWGEVPVEDARETSSL